MSQHRVTEIEAEIDDWLATERQYRNARGYVVEWPDLANAEFMQRIRTTIVALRTAHETSVRGLHAMQKMCGEARAEALEEAARACDTHFAASNEDGQYYGGLLATAIRALKDTAHD